MKKAFLLTAVLFTMASHSFGATKEDYLNLVEIAVRAYTPERINAYITDVEKRGITEHGFARLASNLAIAIANGRLTDRVSQLERLMDICAREQPIANRKNGAKASGHLAVGAEFAIRELVFALDALDKAKVFPQAKIEQWRAAYRSMRAEDIYSVQPKVGDATARNWTIFGIASEQARIASNLGGDPAWVERYAADQLRFFDEKGMFRDPGCPMFYDLVPRLQYAVTLDCGYDGSSRGAVVEMLEKAAKITLAEQSVTGEIPFGGRSQQFLHTDILYAALCEWYAKHFAAKGDVALARRFRTAADSAVREVRAWTRLNPIRHIKNYYSPESGYGCENYAYFNKYMVTMGSWAALAARFADESIPCGEASDAEDSLLVTSPEFHRVILNAKDYTLQFDLNGQSGYDASGLGRLQHRGAPSTIALSVPFPTNPVYQLDITNDAPLAIGPRRESFTLIEATKEKVVLGDGKNLRWESRVTDKGVEMTVTDSSDIAFALPAFAFDGEKEPRITSGVNWLEIEYECWVCRYETDGSLVATGKIYANRNGHYRLFEAHGKNRLVVRATITPAAKRPLIYSRMERVAGEQLSGENLSVDVRLVKDLNLLPSWEGTPYAADVAACPEYLAEREESWSRLRKACEEARQGGYTIAVESDELKFARPVWERLLKEFPDPTDTNRVDLTAEGFWQVYRTKYREILSQLPKEVTAVMIRTGENYSFLNRAASGQTLCNYVAFDEKYARDMARTIEETRRLVVDESGRTLIWRTWDTGNEGFHANPDTFDRVMSKVKNHKGLLLSIKFCETDYWCYNRFNPCIGRGGYDILIEAQTSREYEGKSAFPNYMGFEHGAAFRRAADMGVVKGYWIWGLGVGGWGGPKIQNDVWYRMNYDTTRALARNPQLDPKQVLRDWCAKEFGEAAAEGVAAAVAPSHECIRKAFYVERYARRNHGWLPNSGLMRDDIIMGTLRQEYWATGEMGILPMYHQVMEEEREQVYAEKREASALARQMRETFEAQRKAIIAAKGERVYEEALTGFIYLEKLVKVMEHFVNGMFRYCYWDEVRTEDARREALVELEKWRAAWADYNLTVPRLPAAPTLYRSLLNVKDTKDQGAMAATCERALGILSGEGGYVFEHPAIDVADPVETAKWWCENLGFTLIRQRNDDTHTTFIADVTGKVAVELYRARTQPKAPNYAAQDPLTLHFGFTTGDVDATIARLQKAGATLVVHEKAPGFEGAMMRDPSGIAIQFVKRAEKVTK